MKILVTGATGFVGDRLLKTLESEKNEIRIIARKKHPIYETVLCDFQSSSIPANALSGIDTIYHLAGHAHDIYNDSTKNDLYREVNINATVNLAEMAVKQDVKKFVFVSSVKAGGRSIPGKCMTEENQNEPEGIYGCTKFEAELKLLEIGLKSKMKVSIVRSSLVYGPGVKGNLSIMLSGVEKGWFPPLPKVGNCRSMIHVDDLVRVILMIAKDDRANGEIFIATDGNKYSSREIYDRMCNMLGKSIPKWGFPKIFFNFAAFIHPKLSKKMDKLLGDDCYSSKKLQSLGFKAIYSLNDWEISEKLPISQKKNED